MLPPKYLLAHAQPGRSLTELVTLQVASVHAPDAVEPDHMMSLT